MNVKTLCTGMQRLNNAFGKFVYSKLEPTLIYCLNRSTKTHFMDRPNRRCI